KTLKEMAESSRYWFEPVNAYDHTAVAKFVTSDTSRVLSLVAEKLQELHEWAPQPIHQVLQAVVADSELKFPQVAQPLRIALTGNVQSPSLDVTLSLFSQEEALRRIMASIVVIANGC
ncbi:MAG: glutamate--tRNA ligase, partial [Gammaproteobacteria bacterium]|nr:glutamate--tRNA ligase [Gammaproteobacteria bacterium]